MSKIKSNKVSNKDSNKDSNKVLSSEFNKLFDIDRILRKTKNKKDLKVILKKDPIKGTGLFATKEIKKNETIAYYKIKVFKQSKYDSPTNFIYTFSVYGNTGRRSESLIGDIVLDSIPDPKNNIPFWGMFANEPSGDQDVNAEVDVDLANNYKNKKKLKADIYLVYKVVAKRDILQGEEITIYYGDEYERDYELKPEIIENN